MSKGPVPEPVPENTPARPDQGAGARPPTDLLVTLSTLLALAAPGCGPEGDLLWRDDADRPGLVSPADREIVDGLLAGAAIDPTTVPLLVAPRSALPLDPPAVLVEGSRVVGLALALDGDDLGALDGLDALRTLHLDVAGAGLDGPAELGGLRVLRVRSVDRMLSAIRNLVLPGLDSLTIENASFGDGLELPPLPELTSLTFRNCGLGSVPRFAAPRLQWLALHGNPLTDLAGTGHHPTLRRLDLSGNDLRTVDGLASLKDLRRLGLATNRIRSVAGLPDLPALSTLDLARNPLDPSAPFPAASLPSLSVLDLRRTGLTTPPPGVEPGPALEVRLDEAASFQATLERLRETHRQGGELVESLPGGAGALRDTRGDCRWRTGPNRRAEVRCSLTMAELSGTAAARLGETDAAHPFRGGGSPRIAARLTVTEGRVAVHVRERFDLVETARFLTELDGGKVDRATLDEAALPADRFDGYRRVVATPGRPASVDGEPSLIGSRVVVWLEALDGPARGLELEISPP